MADIRLNFSVIDEFSQKMDAFEQRLRDLEGKAGRLDRKDRDVADSIDKVGKTADKAGGMFKGFGATMMIANQAMQAMQRIAGSLKDSLEDVSQKERAVIMLGQDAGKALSGFASESARALGRSQSDIMKASMRWHATGIGGNDMMEMTRLADRFANLNPGKSYDDVAQALNEAVRSKNVGGLAELLGGGEGVERRLQRAGVERKLRSGDVSGAMDSFKKIADGFGYTQDKADKMANTVSRKIERMVDRVKDKTTTLFSGIIQKAEPVIDRVLGWLESEEVDIFFDNIATDIADFMELCMNAADLLGDAITSITDTMTDAWSDAVGESVSTTETIVGIFVGGFTAIGGYLHNAAADLWGWLLDGAEKTCNGIIEAYKAMKRVISGEDEESASQIAIGMIADQQRAQFLALAEGAARSGNMELARSYLDTARSIGEVAEGAAESLRKMSESKEFDFSGLKFDEMDVEQRVADNIKGVVDWVNGHSVDNRNQDVKAIRKTLGGIAGDTSKMRGAMLHEQDLRWLKERAEQHAVNQVNVRQLTPTINVQISGTNVSQRDIERTMKKVLEEEVNAGTFNAYGEVA